MIDARKGAYHRELKLLIEFASTQAAKIFRANGGELLPMWHAVTAGGEHLVIPQPVPDKDKSIALVRDLFRRRDVEQFVFMSEAWMVDVRDPATIPRGELSGHPDRREIVAFSAEARDGTIVMAHRFILRPEHGKPTLAPLTFSRANSVKGRMSGLLQP